MKAPLGDRSIVAGGLARRVAVAALAALVLAGSRPASAQLLPVKDGAIVYGHHHVNASSLEADKKFWAETLGGTVVKVGTDNLEIIRFANAVMFMRAQKATGGSKGTSLDHIGFEILNLDEFAVKLAAQGIMTTVRNIPALSTKVAFVTDPWGTLIELSEGLRQIP